MSQLQITLNVQIFLETFISQDFTLKDAVQAIRDNYPDNIEKLNTIRVNSKSFMDAEPSSNVLAYMYQGFDNYESWTHVDQAKAHFQGLLDKIDEQRPIMHGFQRIQEIKEEQTKKWHNLLKDYRPESN